MAALLAALLVGNLALVGVAGAQDGYLLPPEPIVQIVDAPSPPSVYPSPIGTHLLLAQRPALPSIASRARAVEHLAGLSIDAAQRGPHAASSFRALELLTVADGTLRPLELPEGARVDRPVWSPDGTHVAFQRILDNGRELWVADVGSAQARKLTEPVLVEVLGQGAQWMPDSRMLLVQVVPEDQGEAPVRPTVPSGPLTQETGGARAPTRTYRHLLDNPYEEDLFDHLAAGQLMLVDVASGATKPLGEPAVYARVDPSPNGRWILVSRLQRPYSYHVTWRSFGEVVELMMRSGSSALQIARLPLREEVPIGGVATGPRAYQWHAEHSATLLWVEALDGGDPKAQVSQRDKLVSLSLNREPKLARPVTWARTEHRYSGLDVLSGDPDGRLLVHEYDRDRRWTRTWQLTPDFAPPRNSTETTPGSTLVWDRSVSDRYGDPGRPLSERNSSGRRVVKVRDGWILLSSSGATQQGDLPVLRRLHVEDLRTEELWRCEVGAYETPLAVLSGDGPTILTRHETPSQEPNLRVRALGQARQLTAWPDPCPQLRDVHKELITYARDDGVPLSATLYLPPGHRPGQTHPLLVWAYPREYTDAAVAGQVRGSPWRFTRPSGSSHLLMLTQGFAIMDGAALPIIGDPETVNDSFIQQLVAGARAAIDAAVERGVADRQRVAIGGHSYGAFMAANLLAHSDLFRAGIARSGAYNRTLTPFGFQAERRTLWEATDTYVDVSPFLHADRINEPLLLIHGQQDPNSGTHPMQSERLFHALRGHGATARLVMLPHEGHGYRARESVLHVQAEQARWLARWVSPLPSKAP